MQDPEKRHKEPAGHPEIEGPPDRRKKVETAKGEAMPAPAVAPLRGA